jgi:[protein-PII] uridylyltransferase
LFHAYTVDAHTLFVDILRAPVGVTHELRRMNTYGVLGRYIPAFGRIVGRMQYDLFHAYTVDAEAFCLEQGLSRYEARLVAWLVRNHLELSITAQKQDIGDPQVINAFAQRVGDEAHLDYLYVLTCADVRGTNPKLWNSWKASLFHEFYQRVKRALRRGLESPIDQDELVRETQDAARRMLVEQHHVSEADIEREWTRFSAAYFLRHSPDEVAWHTRLLAEHDPGPDETLVAIEPRSVHGTTGVLVFGRPRRHGFARATAVLDQLGLTIVDARITPTEDGFSLDLYHVLEGDGSLITDPDRQLEIERALLRSAQRPDDAQFAVSRRAPRQARMFNTPTQIALNVDEHNQRSVLELIAGDRPGLLCDVGKVLMDARVEIHAAKIMTVGERAEDVFYVTDLDNRPLTEAAAELLKSRLTQALDRRQAA